MQTNTISQLKEANWLIKNEKYKEANSFLGTSLDKDFFLSLSRDYYNLKSFTYTHIYKKDYFHLYLENMPSPLIADFIQMCIDAGVDFSYLEANNKTTFDNIIHKFGHMRDIRDSYANYTFDLTAALANFNTQLKDMLREHFLTCEDELNPLLLYNTYHLGVDRDNRIIYYNLLLPILNRAKIRQSEKIDRLLSTNNSFSEDLHTFSFEQLKIFFKEYTGLFSEDNIDYFNCTFVIRHLMNQYDISKEIYEFGIKLISDNKLNVYLNDYPGNYKTSISICHVLPNMDSYSYLLLKKMFEHHLYPLEYVNHEMNPKYNSFFTSFISTNLNSIKRKPKENIYSFISEMIKECYELIQLGIEPKIRTNKENIQNLFEQLFVSKYSINQIDLTKHFNPEECLLFEELSYMMPPMILQKIIQLVDVLDKRYGYIHKEEKNLVAEEFKITWEKFLSILIYLP